MASLALTTHAPLTAAVATDDAVTPPMAPAVTSEPPPSPSTDPAPDVRPAFREAMSTLAGGVCVITTHDDGVPTGLTVTTGFSVSMDPPIFGICVDNTSRTLPALLATGAFVANVLGGGSARVATSFASRDPDKFAPDSGPVARGTTTSGLPWLPEDSLRGVECAVTQVIPAGDHTLVLAAVRAVHTPTTDCRHGLGYLARTFHPLALSA